MFSAALSIHYTIPLEAAATPFLTRSLHLRVHIYQREYLNHLEI